MPSPVLPRQIYCRVNRLNRAYELLGSRYYNVAIAQGGREIRPTHQRVRELK
jgi:hypothetical protein